MFSKFSWNEEVFDSMNVENMSQGSLRWMISAEEENVQLMTPWSDTWKKSEGCCGVSSGPMYVKENQVLLWQPETTKSFNF